MRKGLITLAAVFGLTLFGSGALHATAEGAKAAYMRGQAKEKAKDYQAAIAEYKDALKEYPGYFYANKQLGNCYYYLGDKNQALKNYDSYLAMKKDDAATKAFADRLRAAGAVAEGSETAQAGDSGGKIVMNPSFYAGGALAYLTNDGSDITGGSSGTGLSVSSLVISGDLIFGYQMPNGFFASGGYEYLGRASTIGVSTSYVSASSAAYLITESVFFVEPGYRFPLSPKIGLLGGLKLGYASESLSYGVSSGYGSSGGVGLTGSGLIYEPEVGIQFLLGHRVGLNLNLGYRLDSITPSGATVAGVAVPVTGALPVVNTGVKVAVGVNIYFKHLID